jgi:[acyl-carrier-protein] S-malonyltransferase
MSGTLGASVVLFPGQGVSLEGARELVRDVLAEQLERCCELLGADPFERAAESTRFAQPAILLASLAGWRTIARDTIPLAMAGHSLGELSALTAAGVFTLEDGLVLAVRRGSLMAQAAEQPGGGGMLAILKGTLAQAEDLARANGLSVANDNAPGQVTLSGSVAALEQAAEQARSRGLRAMHLDVAGAFHSPAMQGAREPFLAAVREVAIHAPCVPVLSGMTAAPFVDVPRELSDALVRPVRWRETLLALDGLGPERYLDVGPDRVLARLVVRNLPGIEGEAVGGLRGVRA